MKKLFPIIWFFFLISVVVNLFTCNTYFEKDLENQEQVDLSEQKVKELESQVAVLQDSIVHIDSKTDTVIKYRTIQRAESSAKITATKNLSETAADSAWNNRYASKKQSLVEAVKCDSLHLEYRSLSELYNQSIQKSALLTRSNRKKDTIIQEVDFQLNEYKVAHQNAKRKFKKQQVSKWLWLFGGLVGGYVYAKNQ